MALSIQAPPQPRTTQVEPASTQPREEGYLHYLARESRTALRVCIGLCIIGIIAIMVSPGFYFAAIVPAAVMVLCIGLLIAANAIERRSDRVSHEVLERRELAIEHDVVEDRADAHQFHPQTRALVERESIWAIVIIGAVILAALLVAFIFLPNRVFAIGALVVFAYMLLVAAPAMLGAFNDDIEDATDTQQNDPVADTSIDRSVG